MKRWLEYNGSAFKLLIIYPDFFGFRLGIFDRMAYAVEFFDESREAFTAFRVDCIDYSRCSESFKKLIDEEVQILSHPLPVFNPSYIKHLPIEDFFVNMIPGFLAY